MADTAAWLDLGGKACAVTGGGCGIGLAGAPGPAGAGALVAIIDREAKRATETASQITDSGGIAAVFGGDAASKASVAECSAAWPRSGTVSGRQIVATAVTL